MVDAPDLSERTIPIEVSGGFGPDASEMSSEWPTNPMAAIGFLVSCLKAEVVDDGARNGSLAVLATGVPVGARFDVIIGYSFYRLGWHYLRRNQSFHFQNVVGSDGKSHFIFLAS